MGTGQQYWHDMDEDEYNRRMNPQKPKRTKKKKGKHNMIIVDKNTDPKNNGEIKVTREQIEKPETLTVSVEYKDGSSDQKVLQLHGIKSIEIVAGDG